MLSHCNLRANAVQGEAWLPGLRPGHEVFFGVLPKFDEGLVLDAVKKMPPTFLPAGASSQLKECRIPDGR